MSSILINECSPFSVTKSTNDPTQATTTKTTKRKKYIVLVAILSSAGLSSFAVAQYTSYSGDNGGGVGIRASVDTVEGLLLSSSVDLRSGSDNTCIPATGTWGGKSFQSGETPFETCYKNKCTEEECWSKSYYAVASPQIGEWKECKPRMDKGWSYLNSGAATSTCGSACQQFEKYLMYDDDDDDDYTC